MTGARFAALAALGVCALHAQTIITTVAGSRYTFPSDGMFALSAPVGQVNGVTEDARGNIYFSDINTDRVFRIDTKGILTTFAGSGTNGYAGDGGPATSAALLDPRGLAFDGLGNLYICDSSNYRVRKVTTAGIISTFAGNGTAGFSGDGGQATAASLGAVTRIAIDSLGNVYLADPDNHRIRRVTPDGIIRTFAGTGMPTSTGDGGPALQATLRMPAGMAFDAVGNLYVADLLAERVRKIAPDGTITTLAGTGTLGASGDGGAASKARLNGPSAVAVDKSASALYISEQLGSRIRRVDLTTGNISLVAGLAQVGLQGDGGPAASASVYGPVDMYAGPGSTLLIADSNNFRLRLISGGTITTIAGNGNYRYAGDGGAGTDATLPAPAGVAVDSAGNLSICDNFANRVRTLSLYGVLRLVGGTSAPGFAGDGAAALKAMLVDCNGIAVDTSGNLYFADTSNRRIRKIGTDGIITTVAGNGVNDFTGDGGQAISAALSGPQGVAVDSQGNLYIADSGNDRIRKVATSGIITTIAGDGANGYAGEGVPATAAALNGPSRVTLDPAGNVYFTDNGNNVVRKISGGTIRTVAGNGQYGFSGDGGPAASAMLANPTGLAIDAQGGVLIADSDNRRVRRVDSNGNISTIAGNGTSTLSGDGRSPLATGFGFPEDVAVDPGGSIYVADRLDGRVRRIQPTPPLLTLSQTGMTFTAAVDGGAVNSKILRIGNGGAGTIGWSAMASVVSGSVNWLSVSPAQGTSAGNTIATPVTVSVNPAGLAAGSYYGQLEIVSPGVANSPRFVTVVLSVLSVSQTTGPSVDPASLLFTATAGAANPASQKITVSRLHGVPLQFTSSLTFGEGVTWLSVSPASGTVTVNQPAAITFQPSIAGVTPGVYTAMLSLSFSDSSIRNIPATLTVSAASASTGTRKIPRAAGCTATKLVPAITGFGSGFNVAAGWPIPIEAQVVDDCGQPFTGGTVTATFTNGDPPLALSGLPEGTWSATWAARAAVANVTVTVTAQGTPATLRGTTQVNGQINANASPPIIAAGGILSAASFATGTPSSPGELIAIFGTGLAGAAAQATTLPLPTQLGGVKVLIGGVAMPLLYAGPTQINAEVPYTLAVNTMQQVIVQSGNALSVPEPNMVSSGAPAAFTLNGSGSGQALIAAINADGSSYIVSSSTPAHPDQVIVIYCTGLGGVESSIQSGEAAPLSPLAPATEDVSLMIGGSQATVLYAGLVPTFAGFYQINTKIPAGVTGDNVPIALTAAGTAAAPATIAVH